MLNLRLVRAALRSLTVSLCFAAPCSCSGDDVDVEVQRTRNQDASVRHIWQVKQSHLASLPRWDPTTSEAPVSPHQAVKAASEFMRDRFGASVQLHLVAIDLVPRGLAPNPVVGEIWTYTVSFDSNPEPPATESELTSVMVLMDGKVVVPVPESTK